MATFANTTNPTPFGFFDNESQFQTEADNIVTFIKRKLGDDVLSVELTKKQIWATLEESALEFGSILNQYQAKSQMIQFLGMPITGSTGTMSGSEGKYPRENLDFLTRMGDPYASEAGTGGSYNMISGSIQLNANQQDYDIYKDLKDGSGANIFSSSLNPLRTKLKINEVFHFARRRYSRC